MGKFRPEGYDLAAHAGYGELWDKAASSKNPTFIDVASQREAFNLRMQLYRYRRAFAQQLNDNSYSILEIVTEPHGDGWRVIFRPKVPAVTLRDSVTNEPV